MKTLKPYIILETSYIPWAENKPARVRVKILNSGKSKIFEFNDDLSPREAHQEAVEKFIKSMKQFWENEYGRMELKIYGGGRPAGYIWGVEWVDKKKKK